jgi:hypothetical protein
VGKRLVPPPTGTWKVGGVATDSRGKMNPQGLELAARVAREVLLILRPHKRRRVPSWE